MKLDDVYERFARQLRGRSKKKIHELARSEGYTLPQLPDPELLIQELYCMKNGLPSVNAEIYAFTPQPQDAGPPVAAVVPTPNPEPATGESAPVQKREVRCRRPDGYWRCSKKWRGTETVEVGAFTPEQWAILERDRQLVIRDL